MNELVLTTGSNLNIFYVQILGIAADVCKAMVYLHHRNIVHADMKASNVLLCKPRDEGRIFSAKLAGEACMDDEDRELECAWANNLGRKRVHRIMTDACNPIKTLISCRFWTQRRASCGGSYKTGRERE